VYENRSCTLLGTRRLLSTMAAITDSYCMIVEYAPGLVTTPNEGCGSLCVFDSAENARSFAGDYVNDIKIFECEYEPDESGWVGNKYGKSNINLPKGTCLAKSVTLTNNEVQGAESLCQPNR
jgi:hypothetical protein